MTKYREIHYTININISSKKRIKYLFFFKKIEKIPYFSLFSLVKPHL